MTETELMTLVGDTQKGLHVRVATSFASRLIGWLGAPSVPADEAILFPGCRSVHTLFMRCPLDLVWLGPEADGRREVLRIDGCVRPWKAKVGPAGTDAVLETAAWEAGGSEALVTSPSTSGVTGDEGIQGKSMRGSVDDLL